MSAAHELRRFARGLGIVAIFTVIGPLVITAIFMTFMLTLGIQMVQLMLAFVELEALRPWLKIGVVLLFFFALIATIPSSAIAGLLFAIAAVYFGLNSLWTALGVVGNHGAERRCRRILCFAVGKFRAVPAQRAGPAPGLLARGVPVCSGRDRGKPLLAVQPAIASDVMNTPSRLVTAERREDDLAEASLRPQRLSEFVGQEQARSNLEVFIKAARARNEALDHVLFVGPPGLGKTTLAQIVARELGVNFRATSGPVIAKAGDLAALLTNLEDRDVLFIDEIHRLNPQVEEILYPAMEDFQLDLIIGEGPAARSVKIDLSKFTLIGATTRAGLLTNPLRDRFGIPVRLNFYSEAELEQIVNRGARVLGIGMTPDGANEIARRARGTPRIAGRLLRRVRDFAHVAGTEKIDRAAADKALRELEVDAAGCDAMDRRYLTTIARNYGGGPVGVETLAAALSEPRDAIEDIIEPFLLQQGFIQRTPRGRLLTGHAFKHLGLPEPARDPAQFGLFGQGEEDQ